MDLKPPPRSDILTVSEKQSQSESVSDTNNLPIEQHGMHMHPTPTTDPLDPLNWTRLQKHTILGIVMFKYIPQLTQSPQMLIPNPDTSFSPTSQPPPYPRSLKSNSNMASTIPR